MSTEAFEFFKTQGPWAVLFVGLFYFVLKETRRREEKAQAREDKLIAIVEEQGKSLSKLSADYEKVAVYMQEIAETMERRREPRERI